MIARMSKLLQISRCSLTRMLPQFYAEAILPILLQIGWLILYLLVHAVIARGRVLKPTLDIYGKLRGTQLSYSSLANVLATCIKVDFSRTAYEMSIDIQCCQERLLLRYCKVYNDGLQCVLD